MLRPGFPRLSHPGVAHAISSIAFIAQGYRGRARRFLHDLGGKADRSTATGASTCPRAQEDHDLEGFRSCPPGGAGRDGFLYDRGVDGKRSRDLLRLVCHARGDAPGHIAGLTPFPDESWMTQVARNLTMADVGFLGDHRYLIHDRDGKYCPAFDDTITEGGVTPVRLPPRSPNLNPHAERWVRSVKDECLSKLILFGEPALRTALRGLHQALPRRAESPGQGQSLALSAGRGPHDRPGAMPRAPRGAAQVLLPGGRMSFLTIRASRAIRHGHASRRLLRRE